MYQECYHLIMKCIHLHNVVTVLYQEVAILVFN